MCIFQSKKGVFHLLACRGDEAKLEGLIQAIDHLEARADIKQTIRNNGAEETGLRISRILEVTNVDGKWTIVSEYIKGKTLDQLMQENHERSRNI